MTSPSQPAAPPILFGAFDPSDWQLSTHGLATYAGIDQAAGQRMSLTHPQLSWAQGVNADGTPHYQRLYTPRLEGDRTAGRVSYLTWMSFNLGHPEQNALFNLPSILAGKHDPYIVQFGKDAAAYRFPFVVRLDPEFNGWWEGPFSESNQDGTPQNGNAAGQFAQAWRYIVQLVRAQGALNVAWHWCPNPLDPNPNTRAPTAASRLPSFYPGDDVVDLVGCDVYNKGGASWLTFQQCLEGEGKNYGPTWATVRAIAPTKPWFLGEVGCHDSGDKAGWIVDMFGQIATRYPEIMGLAWFNWSSAASMYALAAADGSLAAWGQGASSAAYAKAGGFALPSDTRPWTRYLEQLRQAQLAAAGASLANAQSSLAPLQQSVKDLTTQLQAAQSVDTQDQAQITDLKGQLVMATQAAADASVHAQKLQAVLAAAQLDVAGLVSFAQQPIP